MKITVATVCFNSADTIEQTINSVIKQTYKDIEYIIVDGASKDNTLDIVDKYEKENGILVVSEPDNGLYDAMNKAADIASGDYIIYMNSGDVFAKNTAVEEMIPYLSNGYALVYGNVIRVKAEGEYLETYRGGRCSTLLMLLQGKMMSHQSIFTKIDVMRRYKFDLEFSITADYDFVLRLIHDHQKLFYADVTVSRVENIEGISSQADNLEIMRKQDDKSLKNNIPIGYLGVYLPKKVFRFVKRINEKKDNGFS